MYMEALHRFVQALRRRKVLGIGVAYLAVGYGVVEAADILIPRMQFASGTIDIVIAVLLFGFPLALAAAWLKPRDDAPAAGRFLPLVSLALVAGVSCWLGLRVLLKDDTASAASAAREPLVIMMDSHHPSRVYDPETVEAGGTNADVISDILLDLPIRRQRESISPDWHRDEEMLQFDPDLIVIHYSGFRQEDSSGPRERLKLLIQFFKDTDTRFLVYSRQPEANLRRSMDALLADLEATSPGLISRIHVFGLTDYGARIWLDPSTANPLKLRIKEILGV